MESFKLENQRVFFYFLFFLFFFFFLKKIGSIYYVITLGIQHHKIWKFYIQSKYLHSYKIYKQIPPVVHFLPVTIVQKQEELSIYFLISKGYINN